jgi:hypothetical protein
MNDFPRDFIDGGRFLTDSPFRSVLFWVPTASGFGAVVATIILLLRYDHLLSANLSVGLGAMVGVQLVYQWWRALRYYSRIRALYATKSANEAKEGSPLDLALRIATGGYTDQLFYFYGTALILLLFAGSLLRHLDHAMNVAK